MLRAIVFFALVTSAFASATLDVLVNAAASFSATIQQQLEMLHSGPSPSEFAEQKTNRSHFFFPGGAFLGGRGGLDGAAGLVFGGRRGGGSTIVASNKTVLCIRSNFSSYHYSTHIRGISSGFKSSLNVHQYCPPDPG